MSSNGVKPFDSNWAYLKTELRWLDRLLMLAVSRQRSDDKVLNKVAHSPADKVTSHWWKGIIAVKGGIDDREGPPPRTTPQATTATTYRQHLERRIQASQQAGIPLALPTLCDRYGLTEVEKYILLMAIAPEINRRYGRLYDYLQDDAGALTDLPTVDLCLRLLCRNDHDWQRVRARLTAPDSLVQQGLVEWIGDEEGTLLSQQVRVVDAVVNYVLADTPTPERLTALLAEVSAPPERLVTSAPASLATTQSSPTAKATFITQQLEASWERLVLPQTLLQQLHHLRRQAAQRQQPDVPGLMILLVGAAGTGKTLAAATLAADLGQPLTCVDLAALTLDDYPDVLTDSPGETAEILLIKQATHWLGRHPQVDQTWLNQWWQWRQQLFGLTLLTVHHLSAIRPQWRQRCDGLLMFPRPDAKARQRLWQQALPQHLNTQKLDWAAIARRLPLTGGEIQAIARTVQLDLQAQGRSTVTRTALKAALKLHQPHLYQQLP